MTQILESQDIGQYRVDIEYDHHYDYDLWDSTLNRLTVHPEVDGLPRTENSFYEDVLNLQDCEQDSDIFNGITRLWESTVRMLEDQTYAKFAPYDIKQAFCKEIVDAFGDDIQAHIDYLRGIERIVEDVEDDGILMSEDFYEEISYAGWQSGIISYTVTSELDVRTLGTLAHRLEDVFKRMKDETETVTQREVNDFADYLRYMQEDEFMVSRRNPDMDYVCKMETVIGQTLVGLNPNVRFVSMYEHSGVCLQHGNGTCRWDSSPQAAMIICQPEDYKGVFNELDDIVRGEFYTITKTWICPEGFNPEDFGQTEHEVEMDCVCGFLGWDYARSCAFDGEYFKFDPLPFIDNYSI